MSRCSSLVAGNTQFAVELYGRLRTRKGNLFFSPYSISTALAMTSAGAQGKTLQQMQDTLHLPTQDKLHPAASQLIARINGGKDSKKRGYQLSTANALWSPKGFLFQPRFVKLTRTHYGAGLQVLDFANSAEKSRQTINAWVEKQTRNKIKDLIPKGMLDRETRLVLTNAIYFEGNWHQQFKKDRTRRETFHSSATKKVQLPFMYQTNSFGYFQLPDLQVLEMPYAGKELSMVILLPDQRSSLRDLEKKFTTVRLRRWLRDLREQRMTVIIPRFEMTCELNVRPVLSDLGMSLPFGLNANFLEMTGGSGSLYLSAVLHKAFIKVNEQGTEAAAATAVVADPKSIRPGPRIPVFRADRPFVFLIRDKRSGSILFLGRFTQPDRS